MTTTSKFIPDNEVDQIISDIKESYLDGSMFAWGNDNSDIGVVPFITFYIFHGDGVKYPDYQEYADQGREEEYYELVDFEAIDRNFLKIKSSFYNIFNLYQEFHELADLPFVLMRDDPTETYHSVAEPKELFDPLKTQFENAFEKHESFFIAATSEEGIDLAHRWSISALFSYHVLMSYTTLKLHFRWSWYLEHQQEWHQFVTKWLDILKPEQCYSGFEVSSPLIMDGGPEHGVMERELAEHFYGIDIDHPFTTSYHNNRVWEEEWNNPAHIGTGLRTATWGVMLSSYWLNRLGKTAQQVAHDLRHICNCTVLSDGVWIETTPKPHLYPVDEGVPEVLVKINAYLKPILNDQLQLYVFDSWDDDPNPRFDESNSPQWLRRFDIDSDWPTAKIRDDDRVEKAKHIKQQQDTAISVPAVWGGQPATHTGRWICPMMLQDAPNRIQHFTKGDILPEGESVKGSYVWHYLGE